MFRAKELHCQPFGIRHSLQKAVYLANGVGSPVEGDKYLDFQAKQLSFTVFIFTVYT